MVSHKAPGRWDIPAFNVEIGETLSKLFPGGGGGDRIEGRGGENIT